MKSVEVVISITKSAIEIADVCMRTLLAFRISGLFSEGEMKFIVDKVSQWTATSECVLKDLSRMVDPDSGIPFEQISEQANFWLEKMEENARHAHIFEKKFRALCLEKIGDSSFQCDLEQLFSKDDYLLSPGEGTGW